MRRPIGPRAFVRALKFTLAVLLIAPSGAGVRAGAEGVAPPMTGIPEASDERGPETRDETRALSRNAPPAAQVAKAAEDAEPPGPGEVITGVYINDIQEIDFRTNSFAADFYVWFRWRADGFDPAKTVEFMNRYAPDDHVRDNLYEESKAMPDGSRYGAIRAQGRFSTKFGLERYPFDEQTLTIVLEDSVSTAADLVFKPDATPVTMNAEITLPGFRIGTPELRIAERPYPTNFGDLTTGEIEAYSRVTVALPITRPVTAISVKTFVPILLIIVCASLVYFVRPIYVDGRIGLGITALLTLVALQWSAGASLPEVDYLMLMDKIYLASYAFIIAALMRVVATSWIGGVGADEARVARWDRAWAALSVVLYLAVCGGLVTRTLSL